MKTIVEVDLGERAYPIIIHDDMMRYLECLPSFIQGEQVMIVTNETVAPLFLDHVKKPLKKTHLIDEIILPDGEQYKNLQTLNQIFDALIQNNHTRKTTLIALGGGVIGDITGFAAACYQRGVPFIQIPTTLLAQVDASVGGKTAVNHPLAKNMIGAFHQPKAVLIDPKILLSLPIREYRAGIAEVIKYGLMQDELFFEYIEQHVDDILNKEMDVLNRLIQRSCEIKAEIVKRDEKEEGVRALLNLGHTFGHTIEVAIGYDKILHGEAVAMGILEACGFSKALGWIGEEEVKRVSSLFEKIGFKSLKLNHLQKKARIDSIKNDKKIEQKGIIRLILIRKIGEATLFSAPVADVSHFINA